MAIDLAPIIAAYRDLLIIQYNDKPKASATIELCAQEMLADGLFWDIQDAFNIDTATGAQLDILGKYIGVDRYFIGYVSPDDAFGFTNAFGSILSITKGFISAFSLSPISGFFLSYEDIIAPRQIMDDTTYRFILKMKIVQNNSNHSQKSINDSLFVWFNTTIWCEDDYDMSLTYFATDESNFNFMQLAAQKKVLPKPMGVRLNVILKLTTFFGFASAFSTNDTGQGFISAFDPNPIQGEFLSYKQIF